VPCCPAPMSYSMFITCALLEQINDDDDDDDEGHIKSTAVCGKTIPKAWSDSSESSINKY